MLVVLASAAALAATAPVVVHDAQERHPFTSVAAADPRWVPAAAGAATGDVVYAREGPGGWRQYWLFSPENPHDRGVLRTGRHAGDWELVQVRVDSAGRPLEVLVSQHAGAERCPWARVRRSGTRPVVFAANGSHALYFRPGLRDRTFPDPNDEADGRGSRTRPRVEEISERSPAWMRFPGRWGGARASWVPWESDSPRGPAFQGVRWEDPRAFAASARSCAASGCDERGECDGREDALALGALALAGGLVARGRRRRRRRS